MVLEANNFLRQYEQRTSYPSRPQIDDLILLCLMESKLLSELVLYLRLAQAFRERLQMPDRDRALVMAGTAASLVQMPMVGNFCRQLILQNNPGHMVRKWDTFEIALKDDDFHVFLKQLARRLPVERGETILKELRFKCDVRRTDYKTDVEFVVAVMGIDKDWLEENF